MPDRLSLRLIQTGTIMPIYCVTYDLDELGDHDYEGLIATLKTFPGYCHAQQSVWLIATEMRPGEVNTLIKARLDDGDKLMIIGIERPWAMNRKVRPLNGDSTVPGTVGDWLRRWLV